MGSLPSHNPWYKISFELATPFQKLRLDVPHDVFSTQRIDEGTLLLLENLPSVTSGAPPQRILDMGCGYGALGLPIASRFPQADVFMVDRDLMAVHWAKHNANQNGLTRVQASASLGFRDVDADLKNMALLFDWIFCNVPARIGEPFIEHFLDTARKKIQPRGDVRVVVIRDLAPLLKNMSSRLQWKITQVAEGPRHTIFSLPAAWVKEIPQEPKDLYWRDQVEFAGLKLDRPFDLGGDDPKRLKSGLPALVDVLPRGTPAEAFRKILCFRCGYGALPLLSRKKWPQAQVVAVDRDLLATTYTHRNAQALQLDGPFLDVRESAHFPDSFQKGETFDLILGELSASAGQAVAGDEIAALYTALSPGGQAFLLALEKNYREWIKPLSHKSQLSIQPLLSREGYSVLRLAKPLK